MTICDARAFSRIGRQWLSREKDKQDDLCVDGKKGERLFPPKAFRLDLKSQTVRLITGRFPLLRDVFFHSFAQIMSLITSGDQQLQLVCLPTLVFACVTMILCPSSRSMLWQRTSGSPCSSWRTRRSVKDAIVEQIESAVCACMAVGVEGQQDFDGRVRQEKRTPVTLSSSLLRDVEKNAECDHVWPWVVQLWFMKLWLPFVRIEVRHLAALS